MAPAHLQQVIAPSQSSFSSSSPTIENDSPTLFHASSPTSAHYQAVHSPTITNTARTSTGGATEQSISNRSYSSNFSRPMSHRHSANTSFAGRSSAPSNTPTVASTFLPTSPTETQATSLFEGYSDVGAGDLPYIEDMEKNRPGSGDSTSLMSSGMRTIPRSEDMKGLISTEGGRALTNGHVGIVRVGGRGGGSVGDPASQPQGGAQAGLQAQGGDQREVRRKSSRFRFDFWKKKKGELSP